MRILVNSHKIGWDGISYEELLAQARLAKLPPSPSGSELLLRDRILYGRLLPLRYVIDDRTPFQPRERWLCMCTCWRKPLVLVSTQDLVHPEESGHSRSCGCAWRQPLADGFTAIRQSPVFQRVVVRAAAKRIFALTKDDVPGFMRGRSRMQEARITEEIVKFLHQCMTVLNDELGSRR